MPLPQLRDKGIVTSAVPLLFRNNRHSSARYRVQPAQPTNSSVRCSKVIQKTDTCCLAPTGSSLLALPFFACPYLSVKIFIVWWDRSWDRTASLQICWL